MITNIDGVPFDESMAKHLADVLTRETGHQYRTLPYLEGFAVESAPTTYKQAADRTDVQEIYLRPAIQSQFWNLLLFTGTLLIYLNIEAFVILIGLDTLHEIVYQLLGKTFPWETTVIFAAKATLTIAMLIICIIFYNLASRKYMIGPKGVEAIIGLFNKDETRVEFIHIRGVRIRRSIWKRILFYGDILIATSGTSEGGDVVFRNIAFPLKYKDILKQRMKSLV
jgi:hypothetical protein